MHKTWTKIKVADLGFTFLKKYCSLLTGYSNKGPYTAPEHLVQKGNVVELPTEASDVYSFGILLWQIASLQQPFENMSLAEIRIEVVEERSRPIIDSSVPSSLAQLIENCWQQESGKRISFSDIEERLSNIIYELKTLHK